MTGQSTDSRVTVTAMLQCNKLLDTQCWDAEPALLPEPGVTLACTRHEYKSRAPYGSNFEDLGSTTQASLYGRHCLKDVSNQQSPDTGTLSSLLIRGTS